jgi:hypothetical protein
VYWLERWRFAPWSHEAHSTSARRRQAWCCSPGHDDQRRGARSKEKSIMTKQFPTFVDLFAQLGLPTDEAAIGEFIAAH